ncbi:MAG: cupin domain-containing protein [Gemmatimonadetes bacterium]|nr:cupin domain-containing protein [Gemmatimonadota bacterium]
MTQHIVSSSDATLGERGERLLARGERVALRVWEHEAEGETSPEHANEYEYVAYVAEGAIRVSIGGEDAVEVRAGGSYVVPARTPYSFEITERATVVEAVSPASALG